MKKLFSFLGKVFSFLALLGVALYCVGYFFASKTKKIRDLFSNKSEISEDEE